jgi:single-strand DNA-binding protein
MSMRDVYVTVRGNATSDAHTTNNQSEPTTMVRIAVNRRYYDKGIDDYKDAATPDFYNIYGTKALGRNMLRSVKKGDPIIATGRLSYSEWTWDDGSEGRSMQVRADSVGHDLVFGTTSMARSQRHDEPPVDVRTGEMLRSAGDSIVRPLHDAADDDASSVAESAAESSATDTEETRELAGQGAGGADAPF